MLLCTFVSTVPYIIALASFHNHHYVLYHRHHHRRHHRRRRLDPLL